MTNFCTLRYKTVALPTLYSQWGDANDPASGSPPPNAGSSRW